MLVLVCLSFSLLGVSAGALPAVQVAAVNLPGVPQGRRFIDVTGRERLFRGINVVYKDPPWLPIATEFDTNLSFVADDARLLASMGFNLIRLGVMWPGVNPRGPDRVDQKYLQKIKDLIALMAEEDIYVLIDPHQDEMNPRFCGEGAPNWWIREHTTVGDFPVPVRSQPFAINGSRECPGLHPESCPGIDFPGREQCDMNSSFSYIWTHAGAKAYQTLWDYPDAFGKFWRAVASELAGLPGVLGGEIWNEPFPGDVFGDPKIRDNHHADRVNLAPFYQNVTTQIREAVPQNQFAIAYEPSWPVGDQDLNSSSLLPSTSGFEHLPEENSIYAFHWYCPPADPQLPRYLEARVGDAARLSAVPLASEWNFGAWSWDSASEFAANVAAFESRGISYTGWQYKTYQAAIPGGTCTGCGSSFFYANGTASPFTFYGMSAPFAQAVAGRILATNVTELNTPIQLRNYSLTYMPIETVSAPTEIVVSEMWLPQEMIHVTSFGAQFTITMTSRQGAKLTEGVEYRAWSRIRMQPATNQVSGRPITISITAKHLS